MLLANIPKRRWGEQNEQGVGLFHIAVHRKDFKSIVLLLNAGISPHVYRTSDWLTPFVIAFKMGTYRAMELILTTSEPRPPLWLRHVLSDTEKKADGRPAFEPNVLDRCVLNFKTCRRYFILLIANGARLNMVWPEASQKITQEMRDIQNHVLHCRRMALVLMHVNQRQLALAVWAERYSNA